MNSGNVKRLIAGMVVGGSAMTVGILIGTSGWLNRKLSGHPATPETVLETDGGYTDEEEETINPNAD